MKYAFLFLFFNYLIGYFSFGQNSNVGTISTTNNSCDTITALDTSGFTVGNHSFKRVSNKKMVRPLKLGIKSQCVFVIDKSGSIQPYKVRSYDFTLALNGQSSSNVSGNSLNTSVNSAIINCNIGMKFFFENVVVEDSSGKERKGIVEPLTVVKIK